MRISHDYQDLFAFGETFLFYCGVMLEIERENKRKLFIIVMVVIPNSRSLYIFIYFLSFNYSLHLGIQSGPCEDELIRLDEAYVQNKYKVSQLKNVIRVC